MSERDKDKNVPNVNVSQNKIPSLKEGDLRPTNPEAQAIFDALSGKGTEDELNLIDERIQTFIDSFPENSRKIPVVSDAPKEK